MPAKHLGAFFEGAKLGRARASRFDPTSWWAHSLQNGF